MTTVANLLSRKQRLLERLQEEPGPHEREEIERLLTQIDTALRLLEEPAAGE
jgi:hypothetical protein